MSATMPPGGGTLQAADYAAITSFILQTNGAAPGAQAFNGQASVAIGSIATGRAAAAAPQAAAAEPAQGRGAHQPAAAVVMALLRRQRVEALHQPPHAA